MRLFRCLEFVFSVLARFFAVDWLRCGNPDFQRNACIGDYGLILPSITLSFPVICSTVRVFRASLLEEMHRDYVSFARANGMTVNRILWKKVFRNALPPVITLFCQYVSYLIAGSAVVEKVFSIKGVGNYLMNCIMAADANAIGACMLIIAALYLLAELFGEILNHLLCPWRKEESDAA